MAKLIKQQKENVSAQVVLASIEKLAAKNLKKLEGLQIKTQVQYDNAGILLKELKTYSKEAQTKEASILDPLQTAVKATKSLFKPFYTKVNNREAEVKKSMLQFLAAQQSKVKALEKKLETGEIKKVSTFMDKVGALSTISSSVSQRSVKEVVITNEKLVPREYLVLDMVVIRKALLAGQKIDGCKLVDKTSLAI